MYLITIDEDGDIEIEFTDGIIETEDSLIEKEGYFVNISVPSKREIVGDIIHEEMYESAFFLKKEDAQEVYFEIIKNYMIGKNFDQLGDLLYELEEYYDIEGEN